MEERTRRSRQKLHLIEPHPFTALRLIKERSLSSILRSNLLTTLINNDVSGKVNASALLGRDAGESERDADTRSMNQGRGVNNVDTEPPGFGDAGDEPLVNEKI